MVRGRPIWLFWFPWVRMVLYPAEKANATISLVVVLPTLPVIPTTGIENWERYHAATFCRAWQVSST